MQPEGKCVGMFDEENLGDGRYVLVGSGVIAALAKRFPQLYVAPAENAQDAHRMASGRGIAPEGANLDHFIGSAEDALREAVTPAGPIEVVFLKERADFETFLQIIGHKAQPAPISRTVGAITYRGLADWGKVASAYAAYVAQGGDDWGSEFARLAKQPGVFRSELVVISEGPYSNVFASKTPYDEDEWLRVSREIRLNHECAHVVCRRLLPDDIKPVWDEVTADVVGLIGATGRYDARLARLFLGVSEDGFTGGRLTEYLPDERAECVDAVAREVCDALSRVEEMSRTTDLSRPFDFLMELKGQGALLDY